MLCFKHFASLFFLELIFCAYFCFTKKLNWVSFQLIEICAERDYQTNLKCIKSAYNFMFNVYVDLHWFRFAAGPIVDFNQFYFFYCRCFNLPRHRHYKCLPSRLTVLYTRWQRTPKDFHWQIVSKVSIQRVFAIFFYILAKGNCNKAIILVILADHKIVRMKSN